MRRVMAAFLVASVTWFAAPVGSLDAEAAGEPTSCKDVPRFPRVCPLEWGGAGHDHGGRGARFRACCMGEHIGVVVDTEKTVRSVGSMTLVPARGQRLTSGICSKNSRHVSAPWVCRWTFEQLASLAGKGRVQVADRSDKQLLDEAVDLDKLAQLAR